MNKLFRIYNQNRTQIWIIVIIIAFIIAIIQILNVFYRDKQKEINSSSQNEIQEPYEKESHVLVTGDDVQGANRQNFGELIEGFLDNCMNQEYDEAYDKLSYDCKVELFPSKEIFIDQYCVSKFNEGKTYEFQAWTKEKNNIYLIKIYENPLASGRKTNKLYIQDYYTIKEENNEYKLNIANYVDLINRNKRAEKENIKIKVDYSDVYMDYEIYNITVKNESDKDIMIDSKQETDATYLIDENNYEYDALIFENLDEDLIIKANEEKEITIKFSDNYNSGISMKNMVFSKVIKDYNAYRENTEQYDDYMEINIEL